MILYKYIRFVPGFHQNNFHNFLFFDLTPQRHFSLDMVKKNQSGISNKNSITLLHSTVFTSDLAFKNDYV